MEDKQNVKQYSKRVRTPKKFFDEVPEQSSSKKKRSKGENVTGKTPSKTPKSGKKKPTAKDNAKDGTREQPNKDLTDSQPDKDNAKDGTRQQPNKDLTDSQPDKCIANEVGMALPPIDSTPASQVSCGAGVDQVEAVDIKVKDSERTKKVDSDDGKVKKVAIVRNKKRKVQPEKPELDKSPERIVPDAIQVKTVKDMVESVRQRNSRNNSPIPREFNNENSINMAVSKLTTDSAIASKEVDKEANDKLSKVSKILSQVNKQKSKRGITYSTDKAQELDADLSKNNDKYVNDSDLDKSALEGKVDEFRKDTIDISDKKSNAEHSMEKTKDETIGNMSKNKNILNDGDALSLPDANVQQNETKNTPQSTHSKRGRKKKTDKSPAKLTETEESDFNESSSVSKFGRKRKSHNYSDILNKDLDVEMDQDTKQKQSSRSRNIKQKASKSETEVENLDDSINNAGDTTTDSADVSRSGRKRKKVTYSIVDETDEDNDVIEVCERAQKKKRGRKPKKLNTTEDDCNKEDEETPKQKKRGRKPRKSLTTEGDDGFKAEEETPKKKEIPKKKRGRKPKIIEDDEGEGENADDGSTPKKGSKSPKKEIKCPKCDYVATTSSSMKTHAAFTHQILWSPENPEGLDGRKELAIVFRLKKFLNCPKCDKKVNQLFYYYHHLEWCGRENETYTCEMCGSSGLKSIWRKIHGRECTKLRNDLEIARLEAKLKLQQEEREKEGPPLPGGKRRAAKKAMDLLHDLSINGGDEPAEKDSKDPDADVKDISEDEDDDDDLEEIDEEDDDENDGEYDVDDSELSARKHRARYHAFARSGVYSKYWFIYDLMLDYSKKNLSENLYTSYMPRKQDWTPLPHSACKAYLPSASSSVQFKYGRYKDPERLNLFESKTDSGHHVFYSGMSVWKLAWCPMPVDCVTEQYIALVGKPHPKLPFNNSWCKGEPGSIQIWGTGISSNALHGDGNFRLQYFIIHDFGLATSIAWCPSGCYQSTDVTVDVDYVPRLGLLAVAFKDGSIRIFSLRHPIELSDFEAPPIYRPTPVMTLVPHRAWKEQGIVCSSFDWCSTPGHSKVVAGYTDGSIRFFNLTTTSPFLVLKDDPHTITILPYHRCMPCGSMIRSVRFIMNSEKHIVVGSEECETFFMDTDNSNFFLFMDQPFFQTMSLATSIWHAGAFQVNDDSYALGSNRSRYITPSSMFFYVNNEKFGERKDEILVYNMAAQNACVWDVTVSNWLNHVVMGDNRGVLMGLPLQDMIVSAPDTKTYRNRQQLLLTTILNDKPETVDKNATNEENSGQYHDENSGQDHEENSGQDRQDSISQENANSSIRDNRNSNFKETQEIAKTDSYSDSNSKATRDRTKSDSKRTLDITETQDSAISDFNRKQYKVNDTQDSSAKDLDKGITIDPKLNSKHSVKNNETSVYDSLGSNTTKPYPNSQDRICYSSALDKYDESGAVKGLNKNPKTQVGYESDFFVVDSCHDSQCNENLVTNSKDKNSSKDSAKLDSKPTVNSEKTKQCVKSDSICSGTNSDVKKSVANLDSDETCNVDPESNKSGAQVNSGTSLDSNKVTGVKLNSTVQESCKEKDCVSKEKLDKIQSASCDKTDKNIHNALSKQQVSSSSNTIEKSNSGSLDKQKVIETKDLNTSKETQPNVKCDKDTPVAGTSQSGETNVSFKTEGQLSFDYLRENSVLQYHWNFKSPVTAPVIDQDYDNMSRFPVAAVTTVAWNPNHKQCLWMAFSGQNGIVHLVNMYNCVDKGMKSLLHVVDEKAGKTS